MKRNYIAFGLLSVVFNSTAVAQTGEPVVSMATETATVRTSPANNVIHVGTPISLKLAEEITTKDKHTHVGQQFNLEVSKALELAGHVVVPVGTPAIGEITEVRYKRAWGRSGHFSAKVLYLRLGSQQIRISGTFDEKGTTSTAGLVAVIGFVPFAGFFFTGTSAGLPVGTPVKAVMAEDLPVVLTDSASAAPVAVAVQGKSAHP